MGNLTKTAAQVESILGGTFDGSVSAKNLTLRGLAYPATAPTLTEGAAGNLNGSYQYTCTFVNADGESESGGQSSPITVTNKKVELAAIPVSADPSVTARKIYRNKAAGYGVPSTLLYLVATIADNTTTVYSDNIADASLGVAIPRVNTSGGQFFFNGSRVGFVNKDSTSFGFNSALQNNGYANTSFGVNSLTANTIGLRNSAFGMYSLFSNTEGNQNSAFGVHALNYNTTGSYNTAFGFSSLMNNVVGTGNCAFGVATLLNTTANENTAVGYYALTTNVSGAGSVAVGAYSLTASTVTGGTAIGFSAGKANTTGAQLTAVGYTALTRNTTGNHNTAVGGEALQANTTGSSNTAIGFDALFANIDGTGNCAFGWQSGMFIADGSTANQTADNSVYIGRSSRALQANGQNEIVIGYLAIGVGSNTAVIGNSSVTDVYFGSSSGAAKLFASKARFTAIPTSASGLSAGDIWSDSGTLKIV